MNLRIQFKQGVEKEKDNIRKKKKEGKAYLREAMRSTSSEGTISCWKQRIIFTRLNNGKESQNKTNNN